MRFFKKDKTSHIVVGRNEEGDLDDVRDFDKERRERKMWRHPYPDPLYDFP